MHYESISNSLRVSFTCKSSDAVQKPQKLGLSSNSVLLFLRIQFFSHPIGCFFSPHPVNPPYLSAVSGYRSLCLGPSQTLYCLQAEGRENNQRSWLGCKISLSSWEWEEFLLLFHLLVLLLQSEKFWQLSCRVSLYFSFPGSLSHTHTSTHTHTFPPLSLPPTSPSLSPFLSSAQPLFPPTARRGVSARLLAACGAICECSLSLSLFLYPHTHTHSLSHSAFCTNTHACTPPHVTWIVNACRSPLFF